MDPEPISHTDVPTRPVSSGAGTRRRRGFTLLELMFAVAVLAIVAAIAIPAYRAFVERATIRSVVNDLLRISMALESYRTMHGLKLPDSLDELPNIPRVDPWGNDYQYLNFDSDEPGVKGKIRKDHNLHPLNSEFDLYSAGPDGTSVPPLTGEPSQDDIIFARDGGFVGPARDF
jgi:general secretion pathway protein G